MSKSSLIGAIKFIAGLGLANPMPATAQEAIPRASLSGSYLAGRLARSENDIAAAAIYYGNALERDPDSEVLSDIAFQMEANEGNWPRVESLARDLLRKQPTHRLARTFLGLVDFKAGRYAEAEQHFKGASAHPVGELTGALARAWIYQAQGRTQQAIAALDLKLPDWANYFLSYHRALIADVAGRNAEATAYYERAAKADQRPLRVALAYARSAARAGDIRFAQSILNANIDQAKGGEPHPYALALRAEIEAGKRPQPLVADAREGMAEAFYGIGEALSGEGSVAHGVLYLQFALYLVPDAPFPLVALASAHEQTKRHAAAIAAYERIGKGTPIDIHVAIRRAHNLNQLERIEEARKLLHDLAGEHRADIRPLEALGSIMRGHKSHAEAAEYYSRAIALIDKPEAKHWTFYYSRGTCYEQMKNWAAAEADLEKSLQLSPDQPLTLNYLGYTWIDRGKNLKEGLALIEKAVRLKPDDGYIVDSFGWAHYRAGNYPEAVKHLERAVELRPESATLKEHYGDALWKMGRKQQARNMWRWALLPGPEPVDGEKIRRKIAQGLEP